MAEEKNTNFNEFLMVRLSYSNYISLYTVFEETKKKRTLIIQEPKTAELTHAVRLAKLLATDDNSKTALEWFEVLINDYHFGKDNITLDDADFAKSALQNYNATEGQA